MTKNSLLNCIGNTPIVRLLGVEREFGVRAELYAKLEMTNPAGSVKDRAAKYMVEAAERQGLLAKGGVVVEATSGNTGIGLALVCALKGYSFTAVMPQTASVERRKLMEAYGAKVFLTDGAGGMSAAVEKAQEIAAACGGYYVNQFSNTANALAHYETTGVEILRDLPDVGYLVAGIGSGGTVSGCGKYLKEQNPCVRVVGVEPSASPYLTCGKSGAHKIEGIGAGFLPSALDLSVIDEVICVSDEEAYRFAKAACRLDGCFVGISSGAALCAAVALGQKQENKGKKIAIIFPDGGGRYLSNKQFVNGD